MSFDYKKLAKEVLSKYPCAVHVCINPYYWHDGGAICGLGDFEPNDVDKLASILEEVSEQIYKETGDYISGIDWIDIFPEDKSLYESRMKEAAERLETLLNSL